VSAIFSGSRLSGRISRCSKLANSPDDHLRRPSWRYAFGVDRAKDIAPSRQSFLRSAEAGRACKFAVEQALCSALKLLSVRQGPDSVRKNLQLCLELTFHAMLRLRSRAASNGRPAR
jgi:hypothetical protein